MFLSADKARGRLSMEGDEVAETGSMCRPVKASRHAENARKPRKKELSGDTKNSSRDGLKVTRILRNAEAILVQAEKRFGVVNSLEVGGLRFTFFMVGRYHALLNAGFQV
ncbi:hypothetical protein BSKO_02183 [Bryopsis sp. KO-2023]|nr:hypothetical protein BSKO_02183 [Bryopsis sp. KO-2023]